MNQRNQKCQTCRFYKAEKALLTITRGKCHRFPPQYTFETRDDPYCFSCCCQFKLVWRMAT